MMIFAIIILYFIAAIIALIKFRTSKEQKFAFFSLGLILFMIAAFRRYGVDRDYISYVNFFQNISNFPFIEPSFHLITWIVQHLLGNKVLFVFIIYAILGVGLKFIAIKKLSEFWFLSIVLYIAYSFTLHEMTQIRAGVAAALLLLSLIPLYHRNLSVFLITATTATLFHYSAIVIYPLWFLNTQKLNKLVFVAAIPLAYILHFAVNMSITNLSNYISILPLQKKILAYQADNSGYLNVFNSWQLLRVFTSYYLIWKSDLIGTKTPYGKLLIKIYVISTLMYVLLASNPSFAGRIGDLFAIVDIITIPFIVYTIRPKALAKLVVIIIGSTYLYLNLFYNKILV